MQMLRRVLVLLSIVVIYTCHAEQQDKEEYLKVFRVAVAKKDESKRAYDAVKGEIDNVRLVIRQYQEVVENGPAEVQRLTAKYDLTMNQILQATRRSERDDLAAQANQIIEERATAQQNITRARDVLAEGRTRLNDAEPKLPALQAAYNDALNKLKSVQDSYNTQLTVIPAKPSGPIEVPVKVLELADGSVLHILSLMKANGECTIRLLNGNMLSISSNDIKSVEANHSLFQKFLNRPGANAEKTAYIGMYKDRDHAIQNAETLTEKLHKNEDAVEAFTAKIEVKTSNKLLDDRAEARKNVSEIKVLLKENALKLANLEWALANFEDEQIFFALCEHKNPKEALSAMRAEDATKPTATLVTASASSRTNNDPDRQARMDAVIEREKLIRQRMTAMRQQTDK